ncbi:MarR family transcriptional regulator [Acidovorax sp.]|jgi:DNA-binding MarR family transcriptional regulator|uniref:MarR family winged helix-turn-helix transcriptional regulator n=1 Tax=Acidovorax sp. TaxID=1872122 RepID=UPI0025C198E4|nr:MarR family transcriptional regulator [Acidovorax sp.]MCI5069973.1 MarR family transcriptional regulator [Acidovorax sp.]
MTTHAPADVFEAMHDLLHVYRAHMVRTMAAIHPDLTHNEVRALMFVGRHPGTTQRELVSHSGADKAQVARMVAMLQDKGWLESAPNAEDKRSRCLRLSAQGMALHGALRNARRDVAASLLAGCGKATQAQLLALLAQVRSHVEAAGKAE